MDKDEFLEHQHRLHERDYYDWLVGAGEPLPSLKLTLGRDFDLFFAEAEEGDAEPHEPPIPDEGPEKLESHEATGEFPF